jgi:L-lactate dehydrogenase (cytochrome)
VLDFLRDGGLMCFPNVVLPHGPMPYADVGVALEQSMTSWSDLGWIRDAWQGPVVVKGVHTRDDALRAVDHGAEAIVVSNHGGRQLDGAMSSIRALPEVAAAVGERVEVWVDGGIRSGQDVLRALALGAKAALIGRAYIYGLGAMGEAGVTQALELIQRELDVTMALCGLRDVREASPAIVRAH